MSRHHARRRPVLQGPGADFPGGRAFDEKREWPGNCVDGGCFSVLPSPPLYLGGPCGGQAVTLPIGVPRRRARGGPFQAPLRRRGLALLWVPPPSISERHIALLDRLPAREPARRRPDPGATAPASGVRAAPREEPMRPVPPPPNGAPEVVIDPEVQALCLPPTAGERDALRERLLAEGCPEPLPVWAGARLLLEERSRYQLCRAHGVPFATRDIPLESEEEAHAWVLQRQLLVRGLTPLGQSYLRGKLYLARR